MYNHAIDDISSTTGLGQLSLSSNKLNTRAKVAMTAKCWKFLILLDVFKKEVRYHIHFYKFKTKSNATSKLSFLVVMRRY